MITAAIHVIAVVLFFTVQWQAPWRKSTYVLLQPVEVGDNTLVFVPGTPELRAKGPTIVSSRRAPEPPAPPAAPPPAFNPPVDTGSTMPAYDPNASRVAPAPQVGDGRLWVSPRPGLPAPVADVLYGDTTGRRAVAIERLKVMVDSLSQVLDQIQRDRQRPSWTVGGTPDKPKWGLDSAYIHVAGIKIPTMALALLGNLLPQGNFDEAMRARQLTDMREDLLRAADRAQSFQQFRRYVRELRDRKQAERDAEQRRRAQDTTRVVP
ncbi:MAG TPA: hypothetical protein VK573_07025 [Gemmatimonadales bacterium]|nr:hypothetical protein [Gemmatimonadales bacterium]